MTASKTHSFCQIVKRSHRFESEYCIHFFVSPSLTCVSWVSCARVSLTWPCPCARGVPGGVWPVACPAAVGLAAPWPVTVATGLAPDIAVETAWPRMICVTTCWPPWPGTERCGKVDTQTMDTYRHHTSHQLFFEDKLLFVHKLSRGVYYLAGPRGVFGVLSFPWVPSAGSVFGSLSFLDGSDHQLTEPRGIFSSRFY